MATVFSRTSVGARARLDDVVVVDLDAHLLERAEDLIPYMDPEWRPVLADRQPVPPFGGNLGRLHPTFPGQWEPRWNVALTPETMRADLDELSVDLAVLFPERFLSLAGQPDPGYQMALARAYNRWLDETYLPVRGFYAGIVVAPQDPRGSAREIERYAGRERVVGVSFPTGSQTPVGSRRFDPIYDACAAHGLAVMYHGGVLKVPLPFDQRQLDTWFMLHTYRHASANIAAVASLMGTAVPARYPGLHMIFIEAGLSWAAHTMERLDWAWRQRPADVPLLEQPPSYYMRRQMHYATQPIEEPESLQEIADLIAAYRLEENVLYASDYPHHDFDHPRKVFDLPVSAEVKRKIMGGNALRVLDIPVPTAAERVPARGAGAR